MSDLISRRALCEYALNQKDKSVSPNDIMRFPSAQPERKKGQWIDKSNGIEGAWNYCSVCGEQAIDLYDFCPNCGADMRGEANGGSN